MKRVGITGGIGSGKSLICNIFNALGVPIYDADSRSKWLQENNTTIINQTQRLLGAEAYYPDFKLNRNYIAKRIFKEATLLQQLNQIIHPVVQQDFETWCAEHASHTYIIKESAILCETGGYKNLDYVILVLADEDTKIKRVLQRDKHRTREDIYRIMQMQLPDKEKSEVANFIIRNNDTDIILQPILDIHDTFSGIKTGI